MKIISMTRSTAELKESPKKISFSLIKAYLHICTVYYRCVCELITITIRQISTLSMVHQITFKRERYCLKRQKKSERGAFIITLHIYRAMLQPFLQNNQAILGPFSPPYVYGIINYVKAH